VKVNPELERLLKIQALEDLLRVQLETFVAFNREIGKNIIELAKLKAEI